MEFTYQNFGKLNEFDLSDYTHTFPEWVQYKQDLLSNPHTAFPINIDDLFHVDTVDKPFAQSEELLLLSKQQFHQELIQYVNN